MHTKHDGDSATVELSAGEAAQLAVILHGYWSERTEQHGDDPKVKLAGELCGNLNA